MSGIWMGGIFLKDEGGYEIILKSLDHYKRRLQTIHQSPELQEATKDLESLKNALVKIKEYSN